MSQFKINDELIDRIKKLIIQKATSTQIKELAVAEGMSTMFEDGLVKAKNGITSIEEVLRVTQD